MKKILFLCLASIPFLFSCEKEDLSCGEIIEKINDVELAILYDVENNHDHISDADKLVQAKQKYKDRLQSLQSSLENCQP